MTRGNTPGGEPPPRAKKSFGQHFLADARVARGIAELATTPASGTVLEIGPGRGALTRHLVERAGVVVAIERDRDLVPVLHEAFAAEIEAGKLVVVEADAAQADWPALFEGRPRPHVVAGNLPYNITGRLVQRAVEIAPSIDGAVFMVQKEVADRLGASPDGDDYGALTVFVQAQMSVQRAFVVKPGAFRPPPGVDSAVVKLTPRRPARAEETPAFREAVKRAFAARRKTLRNAWKGMYGWSKEELDLAAREAGVSLDARGETLSVEDFARVAARGKLDGSPPTEVGGSFPEATVRGKPAGGRARSRSGRAFAEHKRKRARLREPGFVVSASSRKEPPTSVGGEGQCPSPSPSTTVGAWADGSGPSTPSSGACE